MTKKILIVSFFLIIVLTGCSSKEGDLILSLCDKVDVIVEDYKNSKIDSNEFIEKIKVLESECTTDDYLCAEIASFKYLSSDLKTEILNAHVSELDRDCQLIREKY